MACLTRFSRRLPSLYPSLVLLAGLFAVVLTLVTCSNTSTTGNVTNGMATINVSLSDPPSCSPPAGSFKSVFITIRSVQAHISATADDNSPGWVELVPALNTQPVQVDLLNLPANGACLLTQLGSNTSLPAGDYQQIRLLLVANNPSSSAALASNGCAPLGQVFNCVVEGGTASELQLSSQANTGLKIPPGQVVGGPIHVGAGQAVDLNIDFNACASIIQEGNGKFRLKPTLTAGVVSTNTTGIKGQIVDSVTSQPIASATVALENQDKSGTDRIFMEAVTDSSGRFSFCPLPMGAVFDVVADAVSGTGTAYNATVVVNVPGGTDVGAVPLVAETGTAKGPATIQGIVTALNGAAGANIDVTTSALQTISISGGATRAVTIPLLAGSTSNVAVESATPCPAAGTPMGAFCAQYTLVVPASNPDVGTFSAGKITFTPPASGDVLFSVEADATKPMSGGVAICTAPSLTTNLDTNGMPLKVTAGATATAKELDFAGCS
ncbi:MAG TPA: DUF4382 domain-containing protein [Candidatus Acidoferrum sp.]|nr:DUF4382 domain-containing protein [Candidatus Acidoferrum sp.]